MMTCKKKVEERGEMRERREESEQKKWKGLTEK